MDLNEIDKKLQNEYANSRINAEKQAVSNKNLAFSNNNFKKLDELERDLTFLIGKEQASEKPDKKKIAECNKELNIIKINKVKILSSLGLTERDLKPRYNCEICKDTGLVNGNVCECYKRKRNIEIIKSYGLSESDFVSFDDINEELFPNEKQLESYKKLKNIMQKWCDIYPNTQKYNILLLGEVGVGKTFLLKCMAKRMLEKGYLVSFLSAFEMNNLFLNYHISPNNQKQQYLSPLIDSDILFIDDLGTEPNLKNVTENYLTLVLSERERMKKPTIISSNISSSNFASRYGERNFSRLTNKQTSIAHSIVGDDLRTTVKNKKI